MKPTFRILLVRHAMPEITPSGDPRDWPLSPAGRTSAAKLHERLPSTGVWVASDEVKAYETLSCAAPPDRGIPVTQDARFGEVRRIEPFDQDFKRRRRAWVEGHLDARHEGWERPSDAASRFDLAVGEYSARGRPLVIGSHGMVLTAWLVHIGFVAAGRAAGDYWEAMTFPDVIEVERTHPR